MQAKWGASSAPAPKAAPVQRDDGRRIKELEAAHAIELRRARSEAEHLRQQVAGALPTVERLLRAARERRLCGRRRSARVVRGARALHGVGVEQRPAHEHRAAIQLDE